MEPLSSALQSQSSSSGNTILLRKESKDMTFSPAHGQGNSPSQRFNFQTHKIIVNNYDDNLIQIELPMQSSNNNPSNSNTAFGSRDFQDNDPMRSNDQLSQIQEDLSENTPNTYSSQFNNSPSKVESRVSQDQMYYNKSDLDDQRLGALKRGKLFTLQDLESFGGKDFNQDQDEIMPLTEEMIDQKSRRSIQSKHASSKRYSEKLIPQVSIAGLLNYPSSTGAIANASILKENTQKRRTIQSKTGRVNVVTIRTPDIIWRQKYFLITTYISRMIHKMKQVNIFRHPEYLYDTQLNAINDKGAKDPSDADWGQKQVTTQIRQQVTTWKKKTWYRKYFHLRYVQFRRRFRRIMKPLTECMSSTGRFADQWLSLGAKHIKTFNSMSWFIWVWSNAMFLLSLFLIFYQPYSYCFNWKKDSGINDNDDDRKLSVVFPLVFILNILIKANTQYFYRGNVMRGHMEIILHYLRSHFMIDSISVATLFLPMTNVLSFAFHLRIYLYHGFITKQMDRFLVQHQKLLTWAQLLQLFVQIFFVSHFAASFWYLIGITLLENESTGWLSAVAPSISNERNVDKYLLSMLSVLSNITLLQNHTVSGLDSYALGEKIYLILLGFLGIFLFCYAVHTMQKILKVREKRRAEYLVQLKQLSNYLSSHEVEPYLREQSRKYLEFMYSENQEREWNTQESLNSLSNYLRQEIIKDIFLKAAKKISLFKKFFSMNPKFLEKLALKSKEISFGPDELILRQGNIEEPCLFLVTHGEIQIFAEMGSRANIQQKIFRIVKANECFGMYEFFSANYEVQLSARSLGVSRMLCIELHDMMELLQEFPKEREAFCFLKDSIKFKSDLSQIGLPCYSCRQANHYVLECPYLFYGTQPQKIIKEINKSIKLTVATFKRALKRRKFKSILIFTIVNQRALFMQQQLKEQESSEYDQYSSDTSIQMLGETSQYSSFNDIETLTLNQSRFEKDRKSILRVHSGSSKFTARQHKPNKDSESQKSYIGSRHDQSREEKEGTLHRTRPQSISKFGRMVKLSDLNVAGHSEETSELKSAFSWNTRDRKISLSNNYALDTIGRLNSAEFFNNEDSRRIHSILKRSESEQQLSYENILERSELDEEADHLSQRRSQKRHSTHQTNRTNRTNKTSKTTITKTLQQLEMENSLTNSLKKSKTVSNEGFQNYDLQPPSSNNRFSIFEGNMNVSPIQNPRKESQNSNSLYNNNNNSSSNMVAGLFNGSSQNNNNIASSSLNALNNNPGIIPSSTSSAIAAAVAAASVSQPSSSAMPVISSNNVVISNIAATGSTSMMTPAAPQAPVPASAPGIGAMVTGPTVSLHTLNTISGGNVGTQLNQNTSSVNNRDSTQKQNSHLIHQQQSLSLQSQRFNTRDMQQNQQHQTHESRGAMIPRRSMQHTEDITSIGTVKSFELYFPQNNVENIIERYNKLQRKRVSRRVRKKRTTQKRETLLKKSNNMITLFSKNQIDDQQGYGVQSSVNMEEEQNTNNKNVMTSSIATMLQSNSNNVSIAYGTQKQTSKKEIFSLSAFNINDVFNIQKIKPPSTSQ